jgi:hypothetical protein
MIWYYISPDYEKNYGIVEDARFYLYEVKTKKSDDISTEIKFMYPPPHDIIVNTASGEAREFTGIGDLDENGKIRAKIP